MSRTESQAVIAGRFEILRVAGSGGMGIVYQAHDRSLGRAVALKVLQDRDPIPLGRFAHEVEVLSGLNHPHIVGYVNHGVTEDGAPYVVMPWLDGMDLESRLEAGPLSIEETLALARAVADALAYLHGRGLIHRDLKPSNLFLPEGKVENVLVIDLGITRPSASSRAITESGVLVGTPNFIAPEQARGDAAIAPAVNIFALGCVLFECLTGRRLFTGAHMMSILAKILLEDAPRVSETRPEVPPFLDALVSRMVAKEPAQRPADGAELVKWLSVGDRAAIPALDVLTANERRVVTVLVVALPSLRGSIGPQEVLLPEAELFDASSKTFGVRAHVIADRTAIVLAPERFGAADQASLLTRFARHVVEARPRARVVLTTGSATTKATLPVGQAIDRAVAMVRAAQGNQGVLVDDATAALITGRFDVQDGRVTSERSSLDPTRRLLGKPTSCVGRERELAILEATFAECAKGEGPKVALVTAEAGAGKSRLQHEFDRRLRAEAAAVQVLQCRGDPFHVSVPYAMTAQVVRQAAGLGELEQPDQAKEKLFAHVAAFVPPGDVARVCDFIGELVGVHYDDRGRLPLRAARQDPAAMADQIGRAFEDLLRGWCARQPLVIVLEDLHWAHSTCVRLLDRALWKLPGTKFFVLALARPEVHGRFPALFAKRDVTELRLAPIPKRASAKLVMEVLGSHVPAEEVERIVERSEGNGFYLEELIRAVAAPALPGGQSAAHGGDLPAAVLAVAQARIERLEPEERRVLRAASVFGEVFWLEGVSALVGEHPTTVLPIIAALVEHEAVAPTEQPRLAGVSEFAFRHALLRGTAYATLTDEDRKLGHRLAAGWLRDVHEDRELVARHWLEGGDRAHAAAAFRAAAELRRRRSQPDAAARSIMRALLVIDEGSVDGIPPCVELLADAVTATRQVDAEDVIAGLEGHVPPFDASAQDAGRTMVRAALDRVLEFLRVAKHARLVATLASAASALGALGDFATAKSFLDEATSRAAGDAEALRAIRYASAKVATRSANAGAVIELLAEGPLPDEPEARHQCLLMLALATVMVGGRAALARGLDLVRQAEASLLSSSDRASPVNPSEDPVERVQWARARMLCFCFAAEHAKAAEAAEECAALARRAGLRFEECAQLHNAAEQYCLSGDWERSRARLLESSAMARDVGADRVLHHNDMLLAYLDRDAQGLTQIAEAMSVGGDPSLDLYAHYRLGHLLAETRAPNARLTLERALRIARDLAIRHLADDCARALADLDGSAPPPVDPG